MHDKWFVTLELASNKIKGIQVDTKQFLNYSLPFNNTKLYTLNNMISFILYINI